MTENKYKITINACFLAYIVQAIVNNFVPLLFITFQREFDIPLSKITLLITFNFLIQCNSQKNEDCIFCLKKRYRTIRKEKCE